MTWDCDVFLHLPLLDSLIYSTVCPTFGIEWVSVVSGRVQGCVVTHQRAPEVFSTHRVVEPKLQPTLLIWVYLELILLRGVFAYNFDCILSATDTGAEDVAFGRRTPVLVVTEPLKPLNLRIVILEQMKLGAIAGRELLRSWFWFWLTAPGHAETEATSTATLARATGG